jgi:3-isopropylmalate dehydrogenase
MKPTTRQFDIGIVHGEGIGYEIIEQTRRVLTAISKKSGIHFEYHVGPRISTPVKTKRGIVNTIYRFYDYALKNGIPVISGALSGGLVYSIRKRFDLYYKLVPVQSISGFRTAVYKGDIDILLIRQNSVGEYFGKHGFLKRKDKKRIAYQNIRYSEEDIDKLASVAFEYATRKRRKVTLLLKEDGLPHISRLWREVFENRREENSGIELEILNVDAGAGQLISKPSDFDVVVTLNHDGDIICDALISFVHGSRGMGCSANFSDNGLAVYQTVHGGAMDLVGRNIANPIGQIFSAAMMLECSFGLRSEAETIKKAIGTVLSDGHRTEDIFQNGCKLATTQEMCSLIAEAIFNN